LPRLARGGTHFAAYATRRLLGLLAVVLITPAVAYVIFGALMHGTTVWAQAEGLPDYARRVILHFDFGAIGPPTQREPIGHAVLAGAGVDTALLLGGLVVGTLTGVVTGTVAGAKRRGKTDRALAIASAAGLSVPVYWLGFVALIAFAPSFEGLAIPFFTTTGEYQPLLHDPLIWLKSLWVPWVALGIPLAAMCHRMTRAALADVLDEDMLRTARAKGLRERRVLFRHALPAALPPVIGLVSANMALLVTNVIVIEVPFNLPGAFRFANVGQFLYLSNDKGPGVNFEVVQALIVEAAALIAITTLVCDLLLAALDPRVAERALG
jgi:peptide/nickel transport system permease protein